MVKSGKTPEVKKAPEQSAEKPPVQSEELRVDPKDNKFVRQFGELMYLGATKGPKPFKELVEGEQQLWFGRAVAATVALDKMDKMIVARKNQKDVEYDRNKGIKILTVLIQNFISNLKSIKCPKCGSKAEVKVQIFPSEELANKIWDGKVNG